MKEILKIAWRNLWRNRRRTFITSASVFFAVFFAATMRSLQLGSYDHMILSFIESFTGYLQVQNVKYQDSPLIDNSFEYNDTLASGILKMEKVVSVAPHLESFSLASNGSLTKGVAILAIDPESEKSFSDPEYKLVRYRITAGNTAKIENELKLPAYILKSLKDNSGRSYSSTPRLALELGLSDEDAANWLPKMTAYLEVPNSYLETGDEGILVSDRLAGYLSVSIGDSVILMGQGYHGASATGIFPVRGIIKMPAPEIDSRLIIMTIPTAQKLFGVEGRITSLAINLTTKNERPLNKIRADINSYLNNPEVTARTWYELNPILYQQIQGDSQTGQLMLGILYFIIFFGIFGTVLMMVSERRREFGVLVAIGMQKKKLKRVVTIEMLLLGVIGLVAGVIASVPVILYFYFYPIVLKGDLARMMEDFGFDAIMPTALFGPYFYWQMFIVLIMILLATLYAIFKIGKLNVIEALRS
jgi:ABC-type lipoprotein release transport system permease subunit